MDEPPPWETDPDLQGVKPHEVLELDGDTLSLGNLSKLQELCIADLQKDLKERGNQYRAMSDLLETVKKERDRATLKLQCMFAQREKVEDGKEEEYKTKEQENDEEKKKKRFHSPLKNLVGDKKKRVLSPIKPAVATRSSGKKPSLAKTQTSNPFPQKAVIKPSKLVRTFFVRFK